MEDSIRVPLELPFREGSYTSIEPDTTTPVQEWCGQKVTLMMEDDACLTEEGIKWVPPDKLPFT